MDADIKSTALNGKNIYYFFFLILSTALGFWMVFFSKDFDGIGFFSKFFIAVVTTFGGFVGFVSGDIVRRFVMPDFVFSTGFFDLLKTRLFWMCGPQLIGLFIGLLVSGSFLENSSFFEKEEMERPKLEFTEAERQLAIKLSKGISSVLPTDFKSKTMTIYTAGNNSVVGLSVGSGDDYFFGDSVNVNNGSTCQAYEPLNPQITGQLYYFARMDCKAEIKILGNKIFVSDLNQCGYCGLNATLEGEYTSLAEIEFDYSSGSPTIKDVRRAQ
ncbi:MAG: hypothetical protein HWE34_16880 [Methylocystaceae bacterium]|nr:hypothetical protein [Methylocystaceae bacterium]